MFVVLHEVMAPLSTLYMYNVFFGSSMMVNCIHFAEKQGPCRCRTLSAFFKKKC